MKYKFLVLIIASAFLLFGCSNGNTGTTSGGNTTVPTTPHQSPLGTTSPFGEEPTLPSDIFQGDHLPEGVTVLPDGTILLPEIEFDDSFHQQGSTMPAVKPSEPEPTEAPAIQDPDPTDPEITTQYSPGDVLPEDVWED